MIYNKIYEFCKVRNLGPVYKNTNDSPPPRVQYLIKLLDSYKIEYEIDKSEKNCVLYNILIPGSSDKMVIAHHDIVNPNSDNANDNSCSVINAIAAKMLDSSLNVVLTDGEEFGGLGAKVLSKKINNGYFGKISYVLNLELTGRGGEYFFIGENRYFNSNLANKISNLFKDAPVIHPPFNDSYILNSYGIDSCVLTTLPVLEKYDYMGPELKYGDKYLNMKLLLNCHKTSDSLKTINTNDMKTFVEKVVMKILHS